MTTKIGIDFGASGDRPLRTGSTATHIRLLSASGNYAQSWQAPARSWAWRGALVSVVCAVGILQYITPLSMVHWLYVLQRIYYIPIVLAGLWWGWTDGLLVALLSGVAFAIGTPSIWTVRRVDVLDQCLEICVFCLVGLTAGVLTDRQRKQERALESATDQLRRAHVDLRNNFESMKRAERLSALGQLSAGLAHEIRNPLASIEGAAVVLQRESPSEERRLEFLDIIQKESRRLDGLLTRFLKFAKPPEPDLRPVEIDTLLDSVMTLVRHAAGVRRLEFRKSVRADMPAIECDPEQMEQVILNLVLNAVHAMPEGGTVVLAARREEGGVTIDVEDEGAGIPRDDVERVFDPFFTTKDRGTGLGLSVADQLVRQHGGTLTISRNSPKGATFRISLPVKPSSTHDHK